eukprot:TRINITY_DN212_c0_g1_i1.p1 TRINITY_DN212_c0_g1~~TRINITY_DN212_c0_g1_i1.p1  ORF type:complete len:352 (+),score=108.66 TRINITY_DN212_c0_g1_i1:224-1279(+)
MSNSNRPLLDEDLPGGNEDLSMYSGLNLHSQDADASAAAFRQAGSSVQTTATTASTAATSAASGFTSSASAYGQSAIDYGNDEVGRLKAQLAAEREKTLTLQQTLNDAQTTFAEKEAEYAARIEKLQRKKNWPKCYPILHHDIKGDVKQPEKQRIIRLLYFHWLVSCILITFTFLCIVMVYFSGILAKVIEKAWIDFFVATLMVLIGIPLSFWLWYWQLYHLMRKKGVTAGYWLWFLRFTVHILWAGYSVVGAYYGTAGAVLYSKLLSFSNDKESCSGSQCSSAGAFAYFYLINFSLWALNFILSCYIMFRVVMVFRKARKDPKQKAASDPKKAVQQAAAPAVAGAAVGAI